MTETAENHLLAILFIFSKYRAWKRFYWLTAEVGKRRGT